MALVLSDSRRGSPTDLLPATSKQRTEASAEVLRDGDDVVVQTVAGWKPTIQQALLGTGISSIIHASMFLAAIHAPQWWAVPTLAASFIICTASVILAAFLRIPRHDHPMHLWQGPAHGGRTEGTAVSHVVHLRAWRGGPVAFVAEHQVQVHHSELAGSRAELVVSSQRTRGGLARRLAAELEVGVRCLEIPQDSSPSEAEWTTINAENKHTP